MISESVDSIESPPPTPKTKATSKQTANIHSKSSSSTSSSSSNKHRRARDESTNHHKKNKQGPEKLTKSQTKTVSNYTEKSNQSKKSSSTDKSPKISSSEINSHNSQTKKKKKKRFEETFVDGFAITAFRTWEDLQDEINDRISSNNEHSTFQRITASEAEDPSQFNDPGHSSLHMASTSSGSSSSSTSPIKSERTSSHDERKISADHNYEYSDDDTHGLPLNHKSRHSDNESLKRVIEAKDLAEKRLAILKEKLEHERNKAREGESNARTSNNSSSNILPEVGPQDESRHFSNGSYKNGSINDEKMRGYMASQMNQSSYENINSYDQREHLEKSFPGARASPILQQSGSQHGYSSQKSRQQNSKLPQPSSSNEQHNRSRSNLTPPPLSDFMPNFYSHQSQHQLRQQAAAAAAAAAASASDPSLLNHHYLSNLGFHHNHPNPQQSQFNPFNPNIPTPHIPPMNSFSSPYMAPQGVNIPPPPPPPPASQPTMASTNSMMRGLEAPYGSYIITDTTISRQTSIIPPQPHNHPLGLPAFAPPALQNPHAAQPTHPNLQSSTNIDQGSRYLQPPPPGGLVSQSMHQHTSTYTPTATERSFIEFARNYANASHSLMNHHHALPQHPSVAPVPPPGPPPTSTGYGQASATNPFAFDRLTRLAMDHQRAMSRFGAYFPNDRLSNFPGYPGSTRPLSFPVGLYPPPF